MTDRLLLSVWLTHNKHLNFLNATYTWWFFGNGWTVTWSSYSPNLNPSEFLLPGAHEINGVRNIHGFHGRSRYCSYCSGQTPAGIWHKSLRKYAPVSFNSLNYAEAPFDCSIDGDEFKFTFFAFTKLLMHA